jgi:membrane fusion protein (multidrug efflux system)
VTAHSIAYPEHLFEGLVETIDSRVDPETRSVTVRTRVPNPDDLLKPGMFLSATLVVSRRDDAVLVPEEAIVSGPQERFVFAVIDGMAVRTTVETGDSVGGRIEIVSGLAPGIEVIVGGVQKVGDGTRVVIAGRDPGAGS